MNYTKGKLEIAGHWKNPYDPIAPQNAGIEADEIMGTTTGVSIRRVISRDPEKDIVSPHS